MILNLTSILYLILICLGFAIAPGKIRPALLTIAGYIYIFVMNIQAGIALVAVSLIVYLGALFIEKIKVKKSILTAKIVFGLIVALIIIAMLVQKIPAMSFMAMIGFSFYGFSAISYLADVFKGEINADHDIIRVLLFLSYFPKFISGPIERKNHFDEELQKAKVLKFWNAKRLSNAFMFILVGTFMKVVIADRLNIYTNDIFNSYDVYETLGLLFGSISYTIQIFADFAGYSYIAVGISMLFNIGINRNFNTPYMSANITEFWRRWHISLSNFLRDYIYIPLGGSRKGAFRRYVNVGIVFLCCGIWHGYGLSFIIWGGLHAAYSMLDNILKDKNINWIRTGTVGRILTFLAVSFAWIFFRAPSTLEGLRYIKTMLTAGVDFGAFVNRFLGDRRNITEMVLVLVAIMAIFITDRICYKREQILPELMQTKGTITKCIVVYILIILIVVIGVYGPEFNSADYIYMQF